MKSIPFFLLAAIIFSGCATQPAKPVNTTTSWPWPASMDAVSAAPKNHKVLYEDDRVRILEVTVQPGEKENMHTHQWPSVLIVDSPEKKKEYTFDGTVISTDRPSADTPLPLLLRMSPTKPHAIENIDTNTLHLYRVELKTTGSKN